MNQTEFLVYINTLQLGQRVIETTKGNAFFGRKGTIVKSTVTDGRAVKWDAAPGETGQMTTGITWGTRKV